MILLSAKQGTTIFQSQEYLKLKFGLSIGAASLRHYLDEYVAEGVVSVETTSPLRVYKTVE
jgi:hypothetical protein